MAAPINMKFIRTVDESDYTAPSNTFMMDPIFWEGGPSKEGMFGHTTMLVTYVKTAEPHQLSLF